MLNPAAVKLVAALRSGKYVQGKRSLKNKTSDGVIRHCCLGVACEIAIEEGVISPPVESTPYSGNPDYVVYIFDNEDMPKESNVLPHKVQAWLGFAHLNGQFVAEWNQPQWLTALNDRGTSFEEIANIIESEPKGLFVEVAE